MTKSRGFTIIELIVVIAIIAVLAAIVLVNVTQYIAKGKDAAIKGDMSTIQTNGAVFFDNGNASNTSTYEGFGQVVGTTPASTLYTSPAAAAAGQGGTSPAEFETLSAYCASIKLNDSTYWCVDSTGYAGAPTATTGCSSVTAITCK